MGLLELPDVKHTLVDIGTTLLCISRYNGLPCRTLSINLTHETARRSKRVDNAALSSAASYEIPSQMVERALFCTLHDNPIYYVNIDLRHQSQAAKSKEKRLYLQATFPSGPISRRNYVPGRPIMFTFKWSVEPKTKNILPSYSHHFVFVDRHSAMQKSWGGLDISFGFSLSLAKRGPYHLYKKKRYLHFFISCNCVNNNESQKYHDNIAMFLTLLLSLFIILFIHLFIYFVVLVRHFGKIKNNLKLSSRLCHGMGPWHDSSVSKNTNQSLQKVQNLGNKRRQIYKTPR